MNIVSVLILVGMAIVLLLIVGVVGALRLGGAKAAPLNSLNDADSAELEDRLRRLTQRQVAAEETSTQGGPAAMRGRRGAVAERLPDTQRATSLRPVEQATGSRLALPGSGTVRMPEPGGPRSSDGGQGLNPLAARFTSADDQPAGSPNSSTVRLGSNGSAASGRGTGRIADGTGPRQRPELPGPVADGLGQPPTPRAQTRALPPDRIEAAHAAVSPFGGGSPQRPTAQPIAALPPTQRMTVPPAETPPAAPSTRWPEPLGVAASSDAAALDIRAILRGDALPQPVTPLAKAPTGKFMTGPLSPLVERGAPLGAVPFDPNLLRISEPLMGAPEGLGGPAQYGGAAERVAATAPALDFDATRIMDDFDLPDTGFETHVFSTSELIESESLGFPSFTPPITPDEQRNLSGASFPSLDAALPSLDALLPPQPDTAPVAGRRLRPDQLERLQPVLDEIATGADVMAVALLAKDGEPLAGAGRQPVDIMRASATLVDMLQTAIMEAQQLDLGVCSAFVVEAPAAALLLSPLPGGACLAVLLGNPARLGLLRRHVRTVLGSVRAVVAESSVS